MHLLSLGKIECDPPSQILDHDAAASRTRQGEALDLVRLKETVEAGSAYAEHLGGLLWGDEQCIILTHSFSMITQVFVNDGTYQINVAYQIMFIKLSNIRRLEAFDIIE